MTPKQKKLYIAMSKVHHFTPKEDAEARRYLIVNGHIPVTAENVAGIHEFHVDADKLPEGLAKDLVEWAEKHKEDDSEPVGYDEDEEEETYERGPFKLKGVWIKNGAVAEFSVARTEKREATAKYIVAMPEEEKRRIME